MSTESTASAASINAKPREFWLDYWTPIKKEECCCRITKPVNQDFAPNNNVHVIEYSAFEAITNQLNSALEGMNEYAKRLHECETKYARAIAALREIANRNANRGTSTTSFIGSSQECLEYLKFKARQVLKELGEGGE